MNTSPWLHFMSTNLFWLLLHFGGKRCRWHLQQLYYWWNLKKSWEILLVLQYQSPLDIITVVVPPSAWWKTLIVYCWCEKCNSLSVMMDSSHFCFSPAIQNKTMRSGLGSCLWLLIGERPTIFFFPCLSFCKHIIVYQWCVFQSLCLVAHLSIFLQICVCVFMCVGGLKPSYHLVTDISPILKLLLFDDAYHFSCHK